MKDTIYFIVNDGEVVYSSRDEDATSNKVIELTESSEKETMGAYDIGEDEMSDEEVAFMSGFDGGYYYMDSIEIDLEEYDEDNCETISTCDGDEIEIRDIVEALEE